MAYVPKLSFALESGGEHRSTQYEYLPPSMNNFSCNVSKSSHKYN